MFNSPKIWIGALNPVCSLLLSKMKSIVPLSNSEKSIATKKTRSIPSEVHRYRELDIKRLSATRYIAPFGKYGEKRTRVIKKNCKNIFYSIYENMLNILH